MKAIVGLGNPGSAYRATRHNVGFDVVDELTRRWNVGLKPWKAVADLAIVRDRGVLLAEPRTFMNASGEAVGRIAAFHKIEPADLLVVVDEVQLPVGRLRIRSSGSAGGHNGLKSIIQHIGDAFPRLRLGVGRGDPRWDLADHVLSTFSRDEREVIDRAILRAADAVETFVAEGIVAAMNKFNTGGDRTGDEQPGLQ
jgi:PTH1 family peptidyl-tRNA hydrolase